MGSAKLGTCSTCGIVANIYLNAYCSKCRRAIRVAELKAAGISDGECYKCGGVLSFTRMADGKNTCYKCAYLKSCPDAVLRITPEPLPQAEPCDAGNCQVCNEPDQRYITQDWLAVPCCIDCYRDSVRVAGKSLHKRAVYA
jgi:hypothetical protein